MLDAAADARVKRLETRARAVRTRLVALPSVAWAKEATNRKRFKLAAQLHQIEASIERERQISLFPLNQRRSDHDA